MVIVPVFMIVLGLFGMLSIVGLGLVASIFLIQYLLLLFLFVLRPREVNENDPQLHSHTSSLSADSISRRRAELMKTNASLIFTWGSSTLKKFDPLSPFTGIQV